MHDNSQLVLSNQKAAFNSPRYDVMYRRHIVFLFCYLTKYSSAKILILIS